MGIRRIDRIRVLINITIDCGSIMEAGTLMNLSENGMFIRTEGKLSPPGRDVEVIIPFEEETIRVPVRIIRIENITDLYQGIGVEVARPPQGYLDFLDHLLAVL